MASTDQENSELMRVRVVLLGMFAALLFLGTMLWRVQILNASEYTTSLDRQSMRRVRLSAARGVLRDRNGVLLADNRPSCCLAIYVEELRKPGAWSNTVDAVEEVITRLADVAGLERTVSRSSIRSHIRRRLPLPFIAWRDIPQEALARWAEQGVAIPGVDIYVEPVRLYPQGRLAAHVIGYVGRADLAGRGAPYDYYLPEMVGTSGIERVCNATLAGKAGGRLIRVDASGYRHGEVGERGPVPGHDVTLTLDVRIQRLAEAQLDGQMGAVVVMDPRNGDILALASAPSFDLNDFVPSLSQEILDELLSDPGKPFFNRAITGRYAPGSTFKPLVAIAAIENRRAQPATQFVCPGVFVLGDLKLHCWRHSGHGRLAMRKALEQSCNTYFCELGLACGYERIYHMAAAMGFGRKTGIVLPFESAGLLPDDAWKRRRIRDGWRSGDTCNVSIGQGALAVTPLQMATFVSTIANGGQVYRPRLVRTGTARGEQVNDMRWSAATVELIKGGMYDVVNAPSGTGKRARTSSQEIAGKTGTAEYGPRSDRRKYAWMIAFGPFDDPRYAVAIVIEEAVSGGITAGPRVQALMEGVFRLGAPGDAPPAPDAGGGVA